MGSESQRGLAAAALTVWLATGIGCAANPCKGISGIVEGAGASVGDGAICVTQTAEQLTDALGDAPVSLDLDAAGQRVSYPDHGVCGQLVDGEEGLAITAVTLGSDYDQATGSNVGIGSDESAVSGAYGTADVEPFQGGWWYPAEGIGFSFEEGSVSAIHLFAP